MSKIYLTEFFASIQGETTNNGLPTFFIRLSGCHLRCSWCDTTYSFSRGTPYEIEEVLAKTAAASLLHVCVTGGEPLLQKGVYPLMKALCDQGYHVSLETSGACSTEEVDPRVQIVLDVKCPGSKMAERQDWNNMKRLRCHDQVKFVIADKEDYDYAVDICQRYQLFTAPQEVLFSPSFKELEARKLVEWILADKHPVRLSLQIHKWIWEPETQGV